MKDGLKLARLYHSFGINILPVEGKSAGPWKRWQTERQSDSHLQRAGFQKAGCTGLAAVSGPVSSHLVALDLDESPSRAAADSVLARLGLPRDYEWLVHTPGRGGGWHVWVMAPEMGDAIEGAGLQVTGKYTADFPGAGHIELRWNEHYTLLPPSAHPDGGEYQFDSGNMPISAPAQVSAYNILKLAKWGKQKPAETQSIADPNEHDAYITAALESEANELAATQVSQRNDKLYAAAFKLATMAHAGANREMCGAALVSAGVRAGLTESECIKTFASGWEDGLDCPRDMPTKKPTETKEEKKGEDQPPAARKLSSMISLRDAMQFVVKHTREPLPKGIDYPWEQVNNYARSMRPGWLCYLAGYTSHGKTAAAIECAIHAARAGKAVVFISGEMSPDEIAVRVAQRWGLNGFNFYRGAASDDDRMAADNAAHDPATDNIGIVYTRQMDEIAKACEQYNPDLLIVDYLQFLDIGRNTRLEGTTKNSQSLKHLARTYNLPVLCLSQLRRANREAKDAAPELDDLRDSGSIEQDADQVIFVWRQNIERDQWDRLIHNGHFIIRKARMGELRKIPYSFDPVAQKFNTFDGKA